MNRYLIMIISFPNLFENPNSLRVTIILVIIAVAIIIFVVWVIRVIIKNQGKPINPAEDFNSYLPPYLPERFEEYSRYKSYPNGIEKWKVSYIIRTGFRAYPYFKILMSKGPITDPIYWEIKTRENLQQEIKGVSISIEREVYRENPKFWQFESKLRHPGRPPAVSANWSYQSVNFRLDAVYTPFEEIEKVISSMIH